MKRVLLGLSGGVDSSVCAILLQKEGYHVDACFMRNWDSAVNNDILGNPNDLNDVCPQEKDYQDAIEVCNKLNIKLLRVDFVSEYWDIVFKYFLDEYKANRTPNPDILCNSEIKFKCFLEYANKLDYDYIAMGHYARITHNPTVLYKGSDHNKDQTYFLSQLKLSQLENVLFPIGNLNKDEVRKIATENGLNVANKKDSTGICFIGERNFKQFLKNYLPCIKGEMRTLNNEVVGTHDGLFYYTIGQRQGLSLGGSGDAWYVVGKDVHQNVLYVERGKDHPYLYSNRAIASKLNFLFDDFEERKLKAKFRYRSLEVEVQIKKISNDLIEINYPQMFKAVTPGQAVVFYDGDILVGGAFIDEVYLNDERRMC